MDAQSAPSSALRCSVVVPVYNGSKVIVRCLDALAHQTGLSPGLFEIIVVDDGSTDTTAAQVRGWFERHPALTCRLVQQPNGGPAVARNHGVEAARGDIILFTDADCAPTAHWMRALLTPFGEPGVVGAKGTYLSEQTGLVPRFVQAEYEDRYRRMAGRASIDFIDTYSAAYRRNVFLENHGFDPRFRGSCEDQEFSFRLAAKGYRLVFVPQAQVVHIHDATLDEYVRRKFIIGFWKALLTKLHPDRIVEDSHTPQTLKLQMGLAALVLALTPVALAARWIRGLRAVRGLLAAVAALFLVTTAPFERRLAERSIALALVGPLLLVVRAAALGFGYFAGSLHWAKHEAYSLIGQEGKEKTL